MGQEHTRCLSIHSIGLGMPQWSLTRWKHWRWEKWNSARGLSADDAKLKFCQAYGRAMSDERAALNFRKY